MGRRKTKSTSRKSQKSSQESNSEVFVLSPDLLQKLGINLSSIQESCPTTSTSNEEKSKHENIDIGKNTKTRKNYNTGVVSTSSSILETADLMKKSVFLSPTFTEPISSEPVDAINVNLMKEDNLSYEDIKTDVTNIHNTKIVNCHNILESKDQSNKISNQQESHDKEETTPETVRSRQTKNTITNDILSISQLQSPLRKAIVSQEVDENELRNSSSTKKEEITATELIPVDKESSKIKDFSSEEIISYLINSVTNNENTRSSIIQNDLSSKVLITENKEIISDKYSGDDHFDEAYLSDCSNSNSDSVDKNQTKFAIPKQKHKMNILSEEIVLDGRLKDIFVKTMLSPQREQLIPISLNSIISLPNRNKSSDFSLNEKTVDPQNIKFSSTSMVLENTEVSQTADLATGSNTDMEILEINDINQILVDENVAFKDLICDKNDIIIEFIDEKPEQSVSKEQFEHTDVAPEISTLVEHKNTVTNKMPKEKDETQINKENMVKNIEYQTHLSVPESNESCKERKEIEINDKKDVLDFKDACITTAKQNGKESSETVNKENNDEKIQDIVKYLGEYAKLLKNRKKSGDFIGFNKRAEGVEKPGGDRDHNFSIKDNFSKKRPLMRKTYGISRKPRNPVTLFRTTKKQSELTVKESATQINTYARNAEFCICFDFGSLLYLERNEDHAHFQGQVSLNAFADLIEEHDYVHYVENNLTKQELTLITDSNEECFQRICWNEFNSFDNNWEIDTFNHEMPMFLNDNNMQNLNTSDNVNETVGIMQPKNLSKEKINESSDEMIKSTNSSNEDKFIQSNVDIIKKTKAPEVLKKMNDTERKNSLKSKPQATVTTESSDNPLKDMNSIKDVDSHLDNEGKKCGAKHSMTKSSDIASRSKQDLNISHSQDDSMNNENETCEEKMEVLLPNKNFRCGVCYARVNLRQWKDHVKSTHSNIAWKDGESFDFESDSLKSSLKKILQEESSLNCSYCLTKLYKVNSFLSHVTQCIRTNLGDDEFEKLNVNTRKNVTYPGIKIEYEDSFTESETPLVGTGEVIQEKALPSKIDENHSNKDDKICTPTNLKKKSVDQVAHRSSHKKTSPMKNIKSRTGRKRTNVDESEGKRVEECVRTELTIEHDISDTLKDKVVKRGRKCKKHEKEEIQNTTIEKPSNRRKSRMMLDENVIKNVDESEHINIDSVNNSQVTQVKKKRGRKSNAEKLKMKMADESSDQACKKNVPDSPQEEITLRRTSRNTVQRAASTKLEDSEEELGPCTDNVNNTTSEKVTGKRGRKPKSQQLKSVKVEASVEPSEPAILKTKGKQGRKRKIIETVDDVKDNLEHCGIHKPNYTPVTYKRSKQKIDKTIEDCNTSVDVSIEVKEDLAKSSDSEIKPNETGKQDELIECGVCNKKFEDEQWLDHLAIKHNYIAWKLGETPLDVENLSEVSIHLKTICKSIGGLSCPKCDLIRKTVHHYFKHLLSCIQTDDTHLTETMKPLLRRWHEENLPFDISMDVDTVECALCSLKITPKKWENHAMNSHYNVAWIKGATPIDLNNVYAIERLVKKYKAGRSEMKCKVCGITRASVIGFYAHVLCCGKSEEELTEFKEECEECHQKYLCIYRQQHKAIHIEKQKTEARKLFKEKQLEEQYKEPEVDQNLGIRRAAAKAKSVLDVYSKSLSDYKYKCDHCDFASNNKKIVRKHKCSSRKDDEIRIELGDTSSSEDYDEPADCSSADDSDVLAHVAKRNKRKKPTLEKALLLTSRLPPVTDFGFFIKQASKDFHAAHMPDEKLFVDWTPHKLEPVPEQNIHEYLPPLKESCQVKFAKAGKGTSSPWNSYKRFEGKRDSAMSALFCGGPAAAVRWVPTRTSPPSPHTTPQPAPRHYLSALVLRAADSPRLRHDMVASGAALLQIWDLKQFDADPKLALCLVSDCGVSWSMSWCPSGARDDSTAGSSKRLGLVALAFSSGKAYIFSIPNPEQLAEKELPVYKMKPSVELRLRDKMDIQCTSVCWSTQKGHSIVVAGYSNGTVAMYDLSCDSPLGMQEEDGVTVIYPFEEERTVHASVTGVGVYGGVRGGWAVSAATVRGAAVRAGRGGAGSGAGGVAAVVRTSSGAAQSSREASFVPLWPTALLGAEDGNGYSELDWLTSNRRLGSATAWAGCWHCGFVAAYAPPELRVHKSHPFYKDFRRKHLLNIEMYPLNEKISKKMNDDLSVKVEPITYDDAVAKYGLRIKRFNKEFMTGNIDFELFPERFPLNEVTAMSFCPDQLHHQRLAVATHAGLVLVLDV